MESVGAGFGSGIDLTRSTSQFRGIGVGHYLKLLNLVDGGNRCEGIEVWFGVSGPIKQEVRVLRAGTAHCILVGDAPSNLAHLLEGFRIAFRVHDPRRQGGEVQEQASVEGQIDDTPVLNDLAHTAGFAFEQRRRLLH